MSKTMVEEFTSTTEGMAAYQQERVILEVTLMIQKLLKSQGLSKSDLASRLGKSKSYVTQLLDGRTNMTLRTITDVMTALNRSLHFSTGAITLAAQPCADRDLRLIGEHSPLTLDRRWNFAQPAAAEIAADLPRNSVGGAAGHRQKVG